MGGKTLTRADLAEAVFQKVGLPRNGLPIRVVRGDDVRADVERGHDLHAEPDAAGGEPTNPRIQLQNTHETSNRLPRAPGSR